MRTAAAILLSALALGAVACGGGSAPPDLPLSAWIEEAENNTACWKSAAEWCRQHPDQERCQPVLHAEGEVIRRLFQAAPPPDYDEGPHLSVVPEGVEEAAP